MKAKENSTNRKPSKSVLFVSFIIPFFHGYVSASGTRKSFADCLSQTLAKDFSFFHLPLIILYLCTHNQTDMKKLSLLFAALIAFSTLQAQWVNDPTVNTRIANCNSGASEMYVSTDVSTGDLYVQWDYQGENGWSPWLQRLNSEGVPQWSADGIHVTTPDFATWSPGYAMAAVNGGVVSVFRTLGPHHWAVKINADGTLPWGEHGIMLFDGEGGGRSEVMSPYAYNQDEGVWAVGTDMDSTFLQYIHADGTLCPKITIKDPAKKCSNALLVPADDGVFVVYAKQTLQGYTNYNKEIHVAGYNKEGEQTSPETLLFGLQTVGASYVHYAIPDQRGGGYVYQFHNGIGDVYNTYVAHFDENGAPTIVDPNGIAVHSTDYNHFYTNAYATVDSVSNDLIIAYLQKDVATQSEHRIYVNRITESGEKLWGEGILVADYTSYSYNDIHVDAINATGGFVVTYGTGTGALEAVGFDGEGNPLWNTTMSSTGYDKAISDNTSGFHEGQNIVAWVNSVDGGVYAQNIGWDGTMGEVTPVPPVPSLLPPTDFDGAYYYDGQTGVFGTALTWVPGMDTPLHYNLYREQLDKSAKEVIEIDPAATGYFDEVAPGNYLYKLTAQYEDGESNYALTPDGEDHLLIMVTSTPESATTEMVTVIKVYTLSGQMIPNANLDELSHGVYIIQGLTREGKLVTRMFLAISY